MFKGIFRKSWSWLKTNFKNILLALLTAVVAEDKLPTSTPVIHPEDFEATAPEKNEGLYLVDILWTKEIIDKEDGQPERTYTDETATVGHRLWLTAFPTNSEIEKAVGATLFDYKVKGWRITKEVIKPKAPEPIKVEQPDEKEKIEPEIEK